MVPIGIDATVHKSLVHGITLLGLVFQPVYFILLGGVCRAVDPRELTVLPTGDPQKKAHGGRLLLPA